MSKEMKMADYFPEAFAVPNNKSFEVQNFLWVTFGEDYESKIEQDDAIAHAVLNHDRMVEENAALREALLTITRELHSTIQRLNEYERKDFRCDQLDPPELTDMQTVHEAHLLLKELGGSNEN